MILFEDFGTHTPVQINIFQVLNLLKGYKSMLWIKYTLFGTILDNFLKELSDLSISLFFSILSILI